MTVNNVTYSIVKLLPGIYKEILLDQMYYIQNQVIITDVYAVMLNNVIIWQHSDRYRLKNIIENNPDLYDLLCYEILKLTDELYELVK